MPLNRSHSSSFPSYFETLASETSLLLSPTRYLSLSFLLFSKSIMVRTKRSAGKRHRTHHSPSPPPREFNEDFPSAQSFQFFKSSFEKREVNPGRLFDLDILGKANFSYLPTLRNINWLQLLELRVPIFQDFVRIIYSNAQTSYDGYDYTDRFKTFLQNTEFEISPSSLATFLEIPALGDIYIPYTFNSLDACKKISGNPNLTSPFKTINALSVDHRILHLIICQVLHPRKGNFAQLSRRLMVHGKTH